MAKFTLPEQRVTRSNQVRFQAPAGFRRKQRSEAPASSELVVVFCRLFIRRTRGRQTSVRRADASARVARAMNTMDDYIPSDAEVVEGASRKRPAAILAAHFISIVLWVAFAMYDIHRNAAGNRAVPARVGAASGKLGVTRYATLRPRTAMTRARARVSLRPNSARSFAPALTESRARRPSGCYRAFLSRLVALTDRPFPKRTRFFTRARFALGRGRLAVFAFAVFFVLYHLCYENILHHTDGMEYLSDWTFVLLGATFGMTAAFSLAPGLAGEVRDGEKTSPTSRSSRTPWCGPPTS